MMFLNKRLERVFVFLICFVSGNTYGTTKISVSQSINKNGLTFWENQGQYLDHKGDVDGVLFCAYAPDADVYITTEGVNFVFRKIDQNIFADPDVAQLTNFRIKLIGASISAAKTEKFDESQAYMNFRYSHCPQGVHGVKGYGNVLVRDVYPGIDWVIYGDKGNKGITHDFIVHPGANPDQIKLEYDGVEALRANFTMNVLNMQNRFGQELEEGKLFIYQGDEQKEIKSAYKVDGNKVSYEVGNYDKTKDLIIDPYLGLSWGTYWTGSAIDLGRDLKFAPNGLHFYAVGRTTSTKASFVDDRGTLGLSAASQSEAADYDGFILKFDTTATLQWGYLFGGNQIEYFEDVEINSAGSVYVGGMSRSTDIGSLMVSSANAGSYNDATYADGACCADKGDAMLIRFATDGTVDWATLIGGSDEEYPEVSLDIDASDNVYFMGSTESNNAAGFGLTGATSMVLRTDKEGGTADGRVYFFKFNSSDNRLWSAHLHDQGDDHVEDHMAIDPVSGNIIAATKFVESATYPFDSTHPGGTYFSSDWSVSGGLGTRGLLVMEIDPDGDSLYWATSTPGTGYLTGLTDLKVDDAGRIHITGNSQYLTATTAIDNIGSNIFDNTVSSGEGVYVRFGIDRSLELITYIGQGGADDALYCEPKGDSVWIGCAIGSNSMTTSDPYSTDSYFGSRSSANFASFIMMLDQNADLRFASYIDGNSHDAVRAIAVNPVYDYQTVVMGWGWGSGTERWMDPPMTSSSYVDTTANGGLDQVYMYMLTPYAVNVLPIELLSFYGEEDGDKIKLKWSTSAEINNDYFTLEKSTDGINFEAFATVDGAGNSNVVLNYNTYDESPMRGLNYYRLRQTDYDGTNVVTSPIVVAFSGSGQIKLVPNPVTYGNSSYVHFEGFEKNEEVLIVVRTVLGEELFSKVTFTGGDGTVYEAIDPHGRLKPGTYLIVGSTADEVLSKRLIVR